MSADNGRIAIVTGASRSRGIGAAVCRALAQMKVNIFFTYWEAHDQSLYGQEEQGYRELLAKCSMPNGCNVALPSKS